MKISDFGPYTLSAASHHGPDEGMCVMEMVSFLAGEEWSDMPECASPVLSRFCQIINDKFKQEQRDQLQQFVPMLIGTKSPEHEQARAEVLAWGAVRKFAPFYLRKAGLKGHADRLGSFTGTLIEAARACRSAHVAADSSDAISVNSAATAAAGGGAIAVSSDAIAVNAAAIVANSAATAAAGAYVGAANAAAAAHANAAIFPIVLEVLREAIEAGPHGEAYTDIHAERSAELARIMETTA